MTRIETAIQQLKNVLDSPQHIRHNFLSWLCLLYALFIIAIGIALPLILGYDLAGTKDALDQYLEFYIFLYSAGICYFIFYHTVAKTLLNVTLRIWSRLRYYSGKFVQTLPNAVSGLELVNQSRSTDSNESEIRVHDKKVSNGQYGLKCGIKASVVVFLIMILIELSAFIHSRINNKIVCQIDAKGVYVVLQLIYVIFQTYFVLNTSQENVERYWIINHFGVAHLIATTICTGILLTAYHCLMNLYSLQGQILNHEHKTYSENLPRFVYETIPNYTEKPIVENDTETDPCSLTSYINDIHSKVKPFTFTFTMFYVYCCCILLLLLYFHLRKKLYLSTTPSMFFKIINPKSATFSSGAGLSLIVISVITSILTLNANDNVYVGVFLLFLHSQACIAGIIALCRIVNVPCSRKLSPSKYPTIYLIFYFFVMLCGTLEIIGKVLDKDEEEPLYMTVVELSTEIVDLVQAFLHGLLILVGFSVQVAPEVIAERKMPREILIHLAATNFSALISGVFNSKAILFKNMQKMAKRSEGAEVSSTIAWSVMESILSPCEEFNRFTTIIYLVKLFKIWTHHE